MNVIHALHWCQEFLVRACKIELHAWISNSRARSYSANYSLLIFCCRCCCCCFVCKQNNNYFINHAISENFQLSSRAKSYVCAQINTNINLHTHTHGSIHGEIRNKLSESFELYVHLDYIALNIDLEHAIVLWVQANEWTNRLDILTKTKLYRSNHKTLQHHPATTTTTTIISQLRPNIRHRHKVIVRRAHAHVHTHTPD